MLATGCSLSENPGWGNDMIFVWVLVNLAGFNIQCYMSNTVVNFGTENISSCPINCSVHNWSVLEVLSISDYYLSPFKLVTIRYWKLLCNEQVCVFYKAFQYLTQKVRMLVFSWCSVSFLWSTSIFHAFLGLGVSVSSHDGEILCCIVSFGVVSWVYLHAWLLGSQHKFSWARIGPNFKESYSDCSSAGEHSG